MKKSPAGAAAASAVAQEQSHRSSALPGQVSVTTISEPEGTYQLEPTWQLWSGPTSTSFFFFFFFFFFLVGQGGGSAAESMRSQSGGCGLLAPRKIPLWKQCPIIWHHLLSRALPTVTCRNLV